MKDYFKILEVNENASKEVIEKEKNLLIIMLKLIIVEYIKKKY